MRNGISYDWIYWLFCLDGIGNIRAIIMELYKEINQELRIMKEDDKFYIKFKVRAFFGLMVYWQYELHQTYYGLMYRPFYSIESVEKYIERNFTILQR